MATPDCLIDIACAGRLQSDLTTDDDMFRRIAELEAEEAAADAGLSSNQPVPVQGSSGAGNTAANQSAQPSSKGTSESAYRTNSRI